MRKPNLPYEAPYIKRERPPANSWAMHPALLEAGPRFKHLSRREQLKVLRLGLQYKRTSVSAIKDMVHKHLNNKALI
ncbi:hypothetical protein XI25_24335 [Paenibacillus sp. DMB20]|nr:hypothetical protein XI25_24335 [Paenibacillus sp. DMB20]